MTLRQEWDAVAPEWLAWARAWGHDSYWKFHREAFLRLVPPPAGLTLDIGCGEGRLARDLMARGHRVVGIDASWTLADAAAHHPEAAPPVVVADAAALPVPDGIADLAVAFMSLQDVDAFETAINESARVLCPGGCFLMVIVHPVNSAGAFTSTGDERPLFVITDSWFERRRLTEPVSRDGFTMTFHSEHRPLQDYAEAVTGAGLLIDRLAEVGDPDPADKWHRLPMFLHLRAVKPVTPPHAPEVAPPR